MAKSVPADAAQTRYSTVAIVLHWALAALVFANLWLGLQSNGLKGLALFNLLQLHKSIGITALLLTLARLGWRIGHPPPPHPAHMATWEKAAATATHLAFYVLILGLPLTGWIMVSASPLGLPTLLFKAVPWPHIGFVHALPLDQRKALEDLMAKVHGTLGLGAMLLIALHVGAALKHQFFNRDEVLWRIAPFRALRPGGLQGEDVG